MEICIDEFSPESTDELNHEYEIIERIGSGAFGTVMHAVETSTNRECAIKVINKSGKKQSSIQKMKQEITILKQLKHKNIVEFFGYTETNSKLYIIMEFIKFGTLKTWLVNHKEIIKEEEASLILSQILSAVQYLHSNDICHRDIKPENIMFANKDDLTSLKLIDFGLSASNFLEFQESEYCGTFLYMAPEQIEKKTYSITVDIWSIGIIMFMLLNNGRHPFYTKGNRRRTYIEKVKVTKIKCFNKCSEMALSLLNKLLEINPLWRYTAEKALRHPWITRNINDDIPETFNENLKRRIVGNKAKDLMILSIFLNNYTRQNEPRKVVKIGKKYYDKVNEISKEIKEKQEHMKEKALDIVSNDSKNSTMRILTKKKSTIKSTTNEDMGITPNQDAKKYKLTIKLKKENHMIFLKKKSLLEKFNKKPSNKHTKFPLLSNVSFNQSKPVLKIKSSNNIIPHKRKDEKESLPTVIEESKETIKKTISRNSVTNLYQVRKVNVSVKVHSKMHSDYQQISIPNSNPSKIANINVIPLVLPSINLSNRYRQRKLCHF